MTFFKNIIQEKNIDVKTDISLIKKWILIFSSVYRDIFSVRKRYKISHLVKPTKCLLIIGFHAAMHIAVLSPVPMKNI